MNITCPVCGNEENDEYFSCDYGCSSTEIWWCENCGAIAMGWKGYPPDDTDWYAPSIMK